jgi:hypothetical protein
MNKLCECGCGKETTFNKNSKQFNTFIKGHSNKGKTHSAETKNKISVRLSGKIGWNKGIPVSEESKLKNSIAHIGKKHSEESKRKISENNAKTMLGKNWSEEVKQKIREARIGKKASVETRLKMREWQIGKTILESSKEKIKETWNKKSKEELDTIKQKRQKGNLKKYGFDNFSKTEKGKEIARINSIRMVENQKLNGEPLSPKIGPQERTFLNELQQYTPYEIIRNDFSFRYIKGRFPDGHIPELKLFIQFDERFHFLDIACTKYKLDDLECTVQLASLGYIIFRVSEKQWKENKEKTISDFKDFLTLLDQGRN